MNGKILKMKNKKGGFILSTFVSEDIVNKSAHNIMDNRLIIL